MEEYVIKNSEALEFNLGNFSQLVLSKYSYKYGQESKKKLLDNGYKIFKKTFSNNIQSNNLLLVGKVQSGKTANLEFLTALLFDYGYQLLILYGGYDSKLLEQTYNRFTKTFDYDEENDASPLILSTSDNKIESLNEDLIQNILKSKRPIIIISMKRPPALRKVNNLLESISIKIKSFIIDDEGDQASLNTKINKKVASATYREIVRMKNLLDNPPYYSVTATPHANVLLGEYSELKPSDIALIPPADSYTGSSTYHLDESKIIQVNDDDIDFMEQGVFIDSLKNAIYHFILSACIMCKKGIYKADMIIHSDRQVYKHNIIYKQVYNFIGSLKNTLEIPFEYNSFIDEMKTIYNEDFFDKKVLVTYGFDDVLQEYKQVVNNTYIILQNGIGHATQQLNYLKPYKIYIGGDLLQRGLTFEHLVTTFFTRWAKQGLMDTVIQRARWFGYRSKYIELCRIFTTKKIMFEFAALAASELDLWEQLTDVENGVKKIDDIIIDGSSSSLLPTRPNVAFYSKATFNTKWKNQRFGVFDPNIIKQNNHVLEQFIKTRSWNESTVGRRDGRISCLYDYVSPTEFIKLIDKIKATFDTYPFDKSDIKKIVKNNKVVLQLMFNPEDPTDIRKRTFDDDFKVSALQQGADTEDETKKKYEGDSYVLVDKDAVTVQIFKILSKGKINEPHIYTQYMFSIYVPTEYKGFKKVEKNDQ